MSARDDLAYAAGALTPARRVAELLDAYRAEVLREAADAADTIAESLKAKSPRHYSQRECATYVRTVGSAIRRMAEGGDAR
jgi:hypothetical protein